MHKDKGMEPKRQPIFEDVFNLIGHVGRFQICIYLFCCVAEVSVSLTISFYALEFINLGWSCAPSAVTNSNSTNPKNATGGDGDNSLWQFCPADGSLCSNVTYVDYLTSISTEWDFICDRQYLGPLTASLFFVGLLIGSSVSGYISDTYGRKKTVVVMWLLMIITQSLSGLSPVWEMYLPVRILSGFTAGGGSTVAMVLALEYLGPRYRILTANRFGWQIGGMLLALFGHLLRKWGHVALACGLLTAPFLPFFAIFMPESARWSIQKGRMDEAKYWIKTIARWNRKPEPDLTLLDDIAETEKASMRMTRNYTYLDLFHSKKYAMRSLVLCLVWFDVALAGYGIVGDMGALTGNLYLNLFIISLCLVSFEWVAIPIANKIGRVKTYLLYKMGLIPCMVVVMCLAIVDAKKYSVYITPIVLFSFVFQTGVWALAFVFAVETFPTLVRTRASALGNVAGRVAGIIAPQIGLLKTFHPSIPYVIYLTLAVASTILAYIVMPETNNKPLLDDIPGHKESAAENGELTYDQLGHKEGEDAAGINGELKDGQLGHKEGAEAAGVNGELKSGQLGHKEGEEAAGVNGELNDCQLADKAIQADL